MTIPNTFRKSRENIIQSFNWTDIAEGTGIIKFYGFKTASGGYTLSKNQFYSDVIGIGGNYTADDNSFVKTIDIDFDLELNMPQILKGTAFFNFCYKTNNITTPISDKYSIKLRKWDGTTETEIASVNSADLISDGLNFVCESLEIPKTHFKKGETIRITIEIWIKRNSTMDVNGIIFGTDPMNRKFSYSSYGDTITLNPSTDDPLSTTRFEAYLPFDLNL